MGSSLSCCNHERKDRGKSIVELNLEDTCNDYNKKTEKIITLGADEKMTDLQESTKCNSESKNIFAEHMKKASENIKENVFQDGASIKRLDSSRCPILALTMTKIVSKTREVSNHKIMYLGLDNSKRNDGIVYFGNSHPEIGEIEEVDILLDCLNQDDERLM